jgi:hypothetical protein
MMSEKKRNYNEETSEQEMTKRKRAANGRRCAEGVGLKGTARVK